MRSFDIAKQLVSDSAVLLKNDEHILPLQQGKLVAFFGRAQLDTVLSGNGSGRSSMKQHVCIVDECEKNGLHAETRLKDFYVRALSEEKKESNPIHKMDPEEVVNSGLIYEIFGKYHAPEPEPDIPADLLHDVSEVTDTAILVIGRKSGGEECDRRRNEDYELTASEKKLVESVSSSFAHVVVILNINGMINLSWTEEYRTIQSVLFLGVPGEAGPQALAEILIGKTSPSGKLAFTVAKHFEDYPSAKHFTWSKDSSDDLLTYESYGLQEYANADPSFTKHPVSVYWEGVYMGYRYFSTFNKKPLFPFGFGLSYTTFSCKVIQVSKESESVKVILAVQNTGESSGKEVVQLYITPHSSNPEHPKIELVAFEKTKELCPGEEERIIIDIPLKRMAHYNAIKSLYEIEAGNYELQLGSDSEHISCIALLHVAASIVVEKCQPLFQIYEGIQEHLSFLRREYNGEISAGNCEIVLEITEADLRKNKPKPVTCFEPSIQTLSKMSVLELAALCVGYGPGTPFPSITGQNAPATIQDETGTDVTTNDHPKGICGYVSPAIAKYGIHSVFYRDGPAGVGMTAWPSEMLIACSFDKRLWYDFGNAVGGECEDKCVNVWLAPALNLHRHPLGGRNFEYFSEDPLLAGICGVEIAKGVQENHNVLVCPKHFAANEQETWRRGSSKRNFDAVDSIIEEAALREIYLKPFEMMIRESSIACIMTSFNKINGTFAAGSHDLCTQILRGEWNYQGVVVTDWGDMDIVVDGADAVLAGNDVVMPGGPPVIAQILAGIQSRRISRETLELAVKHLFYLLWRASSGKKGPENNA